MMRLVSRCAVQSQLGSVLVRGGAARSWLPWTELDGWSKKYDVEQIAREVRPDECVLFLRVLDETKPFAKAVNLPRVGVAN